MGARSAGMRGQFPRIPLRSMRAIGATRADSGAPRQGYPSMRKLILGALAVAAAMAAGLATAGASNRFSWCMVVQDRSGIWACAFDTFEQCLAEARPGNQGFCARNPFYQ